MVGLTRITFLGHATLRIDLDSAVFLTDPILRTFAWGLVHRQPVQHLGQIVDGVDDVLISHLHRDHLDLASLHRLPGNVEVIVPRGGGGVVLGAGLSKVRELGVGECVSVRGVQVHATPAAHSGFRPPFGPTAECLGFVLEGSRRIYFAGDTDIFDGMAEIGPLDVALLPVAGWGPRLGSGHMGPAEAVKALDLLRPKLVVPIHWGSLVPMGMHVREWSYLTRPPQSFAEMARQARPNVEVRILEPGQTLDLTSAEKSADRPIGNSPN
jgi:L-ascorbate metabolism protein UlaG (beta-lactamase superfamily)